MSLPLLLCMSLQLMEQDVRSDHMYSRNAGSLLGAESQIASTNSRCVYSCADRSSRIRLMERWYRAGYAAALVSLEEKLTILGR